VSRHEPSSEASSSGFLFGFESAPVHLRVLAGLIFSTLCGVAVDAPARLLLLADSWLLIGAASTQMIHWLIHIKAGYLGIKTAAARKLTVVTITHLLGILLVLFLGVKAVHHATLGILLQGIGVGFVVSFAVAMATSHLLQDPDLEHLNRGTEWVHERKVTARLKRLLEPVKHYPLISSALAFLNWITPKKEASGYVLAAGFWFLTIGASAGFATITHEHSKRPGPSAPVLQSQQAQRLFENFTLFPPLRIPVRKHSPVASAKPPVSTLSTYQIDCKGWPAPGQGAHLREASELKARYEGSKRIKGLGANVAGCAYKTRPERDQRLHYWVTGWCLAQLRSVAVASPKGSAIMLQQIATFARTLAMRGQLLGASRDIRIGSGDLQIVWSKYGDVVFVRQEQSAGAVANAQPLGACSATTSINVRYVALPPAMVVLWVRLMTQAKQWLWPVYQAAGSARAFMFESAKSERDVGSGECRLGGNCTVVLGKQHWSLRFNSRGRITLQVLKRYAPPAV
jgi:hypothetical protein